MTGFLTFFAAVAFTVAGIALTAVRARYVHRRTASSAMKEMAVTGGSLVAYVAVCVLLGYGVLPQLLGCLAGGVVLWFGRSWIPMLAGRGSHDAEA